MMARTAAPIRFNARLLRPASPKGAAWSFLLLPAGASARLPTRSMVAVAGSLAGRPFRATLEPDGQGGHWLKVTRALREAAGVAPGDTVAIEMAPAEKQPVPAVPLDLRRALQAVPEAGAQWTTLTPVARRDWIAWLTSAKKRETRARRVQAACSMLASGKRRVCCFDRSGIYGGSFAAPEAAG